MKLTLSKIYVKGMEWGEETTINKGILYVNRTKAIEACGNAYAIEEIALHIARPGESIRIMPTKDVIEPRCKLSEEGSVFPGLIGDMAQAGIGETLSLKGSAVVVTQSNDKECICRTAGFIDMVGPATEWCYFSKTFNLVLEAKMNAEVLKNNPDKSDDACRIAGLKLAVFLADECKECEPDEQEVFELNETDKNLPGVVYVLQLLAQKPLIKDFWIYGQLGGESLLPTLLHPNEAFDGAITSFIGNFCMVCCDKQTNYELQNSRIIEELYKRHGKDLRFLGVIVHNATLTLEGKLRASLYSTKLAKMLDAKGAILITEGHGNPDEDLIMNCKHFERSGISTVIISDELAGRDGKSAGMVDWTPECTAMISTGNAHELIAIPKVQQIFIGNEPSQIFLKANVDNNPEDTDLMFTEALTILGSENQAGFYKISARWV